MVLLSRSPQGIAHALAIPSPLLSSSSNSLRSISLPRPHSLLSLPLTVSVFNLTNVFSWRCLFMSYFPALSFPLLLYLSVSARVISYFVRFTIFYDNRGFLYIIGFRSQSAFALGYCCAATCKASRSCQLVNKRLEYRPHELGPIAVKLTLHLKGFSIIK